MSVDMVGFDRRKSLNEDEDVNNITFCVAK